VKNNIEDLNILVVGDIMLDKYLLGTVSRISPEAPVPVVDVTEEYHTLGGCGNVVRNIREIGANVDCISSVGLDNDGDIIRELLWQLGVGDALVNGSSQTTIKERIVATTTKTQMLRIDRETIKKVDSKIAIDTFESLIKKEKYNIIVVSDYAKGMITKELMTYLHTLDTKIIVDPKPINGFLYNNVYMITPNKKEWEAMAYSSEYSLNKVKFILETKGSEGMSLFDKDKHYLVELPSEPKAVFNVSGAGDTVVAVMSICLSLGIVPQLAAEIANECAGYVVTQPGTSTIPKEIFLKYLKKITNQ